MSRFRFPLLILALALLVSGCIGPYKSPYPPLSVSGNEQIQTAYLQNPDSYLEGIWTFNGDYDVAILKNDFGVPGCEYVGVISQSRSSFFSEGAFVLRINTSAIEGVYVAEYADGTGNFTLLARNYGVMDTSGNRWWPHLIRLFPKQVSASKGRIVSGTGWFSSTGYIVTNNHVVDGAKKIEVQYRGKTYPATSVLADKQNDIAVLSVDSNCEMPPNFLFSTGKPALGEKVFTVGFPQTGILGSSAKYASGEVSSLKGMKDDPRFLQTSIPVHGGNSGGPLIDEDGRVVGMVTSKINNMVFLEKAGDVAPNISYAIKRQYIEMLTDSLDARKACTSEFKGKGAGLDLSEIVVRVVAE